MEARAFLEASNYGNKSYGMISQPPSFVATISTTEVHKELCSVIVSERDIND